MDAVIFVCLALYIIASPSSVKVKANHDKVTLDVKAESAPRKTKLNDTFYEDANAFMRIATALGFK